ncbi:hypothetical protein ACJX0J_038086 [Zea mays]
MLHTPLTTSLVLYFALYLFMTKSIGLYSKCNGGKTLNYFVKIFGDVVGSKLKNKNKPIGLSIYSKEEMEEDRVGQKKIKWCVCFHFIMVLFSKNNNAAYVII